MFKLTRPCNNCPFRVGQKFFLGEERVNEILEAPAFQCHKTVDYSDSLIDGSGKPGDHPQQCAGLMALLHKAERPSQIMQVGERLGAFDPNKLDHSDVYESISDCLEAHK